MRIEKINNDSSLYDALQLFVIKHGLLFNSAAWMNNYDSDAISQCVILNKNNDVIGCFVYYTFWKSIFKIVITPPFAPHIELFCINPSESIVGVNSFNKDVVTLVAGYFDSLKADHVDINLPEEIIDTQPFTWKGYVAKTRYTYTIDLSQSEENLKANLSTEKRKSLNKAQKDSLRVAITNDKQSVFQLISKSLSRSGIFKNVSILKNILFKYSSSENSFAFVAEQNGVAAGASFCLSDSKKAIYLFGGLDPENSHHGAGVSCMWQSILEAKKRGLQIFDFEGSMNAAIERYFREFGGRLTPYFAVTKSRPLFNILLTVTGRKK